MIHVTTAMGSLLSRSFAAIVASALPAATLPLATAIVLSGSIASAQTSVAGMPAYEVCGSWKNKLSHYGSYNISNYNALVPPNLAVPAEDEMPRAEWQFFDDGTTRGFPVNNAFSAIFDIVDLTGTSRPQVIDGTWEQNARKLKLEVNTAIPAEAFANSAGVLLALNQMITTRPHGFFNQSGPYRLRAGNLPADVLGVLPAPLNVTTSYYIIYVSPTALSLSLMPGGAAVDLTTQGTGRHTIYPYGEPLANSYALLSELFLFGDREVIGVLDFLSISRVRLRAKVDPLATELRVKLSGSANYDLDTEDLVEEGFTSPFRYEGDTANCPGSVSVSRR